MTTHRRPLGRVFDEVPDLYDRMRPGYPPALFRDLAQITGIGAGSDVLEVGCGTGQATRPFAGLAASVTAVEPGDGMAELARRRLADLGNVDIERSTFEAWDDKGRRFDAVVVASSWHWVDRGRMASSPRRAAADDDSTGAPMRRCDELRCAQSSN